MPSVHPPRDASSGAALAGTSPLPARSLASVRQWSGLAGPARRARSCLLSSRFPSLDAESLTMPGPVFPARSQPPVSGNPQPCSAGHSVAWHAPWHPRHVPPVSLPRCVLPSATIPRSSALPRSSHDGFQQNLDFVSSQRSTFGGVTLNAGIVADQFHLIAI